MGPALWWELALAAARAFKVDPDRVALTRRQADAAMAAAGACAGGGSLALEQARAARPTPAEANAASLEVAGLSDRGLLGVWVLDEAAGAAAARAREVVDAASRPAPLSWEEYKRRNWVNQEAGFLCVVGKMSATEEEALILALVAAGEEGGEAGAALAPSPGGAATPSGAGSAAVGE